MIITIDLMYVLEILGIGVTLGVLTFISMIFFDMFVKNIAKLIKINYDRKLVWVMYSCLILGVAATSLMRLVVAGLTQLDMKVDAETTVTFFIAAMIHIAITNGIFKTVEDKE